jgi:hypothetical protein
VPALTQPDAPRWRLIAILLLAGIALRILHADEFGSDVLAVTRSAIRYVSMGENPYGHGYLDSRPPGAPFAYGPLALLWYAAMPRDFAGTLFTGWWATVAYWAAVLPIAAWHVDAWHREVIVAAEPVRRELPDAR